MENYTQEAKVQKIKEAMQDEISKKLLEARIELMRTQDEWEFYRKVDSVVNSVWHCGELEQYLERIKPEGIIIFGCGHDGRESKRVLDVCKIPLDFFCDSDNSKVGTKIDGVAVISVEEAVEKYQRYVVILGSKIYYREMQDRLLALGFPKDHIIQSRNLLFQAYTGKQYFDIFEAEEAEVFIDAGAYGGETMLDFVKWTGGKYKKIIELEPLKEMCTVIREMCEQRAIRSVQIEEVAAWDKREKLFFSEEKSGSKVEEQGERLIKGVDIDSIVGDEIVTFIKMDIEGSERKALEGARNTIKRDKPKLAVCLYHRLEDIIELPSYILELVPEYKLYIRHYRSNVCETVLYAEYVEEAE